MTSPLSLLEKYITKDYIFDPASEPERTKGEKLFRTLCSKFSGSYPSIVGFDKWINTILPKQIMDQSFVSEDGVEITFDKVQIDKPIRISSDGRVVPLYPDYCRNRRFPYTGKLSARCTIEKKNGEKKQTTIVLGEIPIMLGSEKCNLYGKTKEQLVELGECVTDPFGYFIIYSERSIISQDKLRKYIPLVSPHYKTKKPRLNITYLTSSKHYLNLGKKWNTIKLEDPRGTNYNQTKINTFPIFLVYKLFDNLDPEEAYEKYIAKLILPKYRRRVKNCLEESIIKANSVNNVFDYVYRKKQEYSEKIKKTDSNYETFVRDQFESEIFVNITDKNRKHRISRKLTMISYMVVRFAMVLIGELPLDSKDNWGNKRFENPAVLLETLFNCAFAKTIIADSKKSKSSSAKVDFFYFAEQLRQKSPEVLKQTFTSSLNTATWGVPKKKFTRENHAESTRRETPLELYSISSKLVSKVPIEHKLKEVREVQPSQRNRHCIIETPEGQQVGIVKYSSLTGIYSLNNEDFDFEQYVIDKVEKHSQTHRYLLMINGINMLDKEGNIAYCQENIVDYLISLKRSGKIPFDTEIIKDRNVNLISIFSDSSRPICPYLIVNKKTRKLKIEEDNAWDKSFEDLITSGYIEMLSAKEEDDENIVISKSIEHFDFCNKKLKSLSGDEKTYFESITGYSHCNIDPNQMFSISASTCPMVNRQMAPRGTYQASMGKQALGFFNTNYHLRFDTMFKQLYRAGRSLTETNTYFIPGMDLFPCGQIANVAFIAEADNQEDSIVVCEDYINSKNFNYTKYVTVDYIQNTQLAGAVEQIKVPPLKYGEDPQIYRNLDENGLPKLDTYMRCGDCIVGKVKISPKGEKNSSIYAGIDDYGWVDRILITNEKETQKPMFKIKLKEYRKYIAGDKVALRYAQKGTLGRVASREEMIRISSGPNKGLVPDILFNQHGYPTRSTAGLLIEGIVTKAAAYNGQRVNVSSYKDIDLSVYQKVLRDNGMDENGYETMEYPNGEKLDNPVVVVPLYEQALKHHVLDKIQKRTTGPRSIDTHQPRGGRKRGSGLRVGEMEVWSFEGHGASGVIKERLMKSSDEYKIIVCKNCGTMINNKICKFCDNSSPGVILVPYVFKLLIHLLLGIGIDVRINTKK